MGLFYSDSGSSDAVIFHTSKEIKERLYKITTLSHEQREMIAGEIIKKLGDGKITQFEGKSELNHVFYQMYQDGKISQTDYESLKKLWE